MGYISKTALKSSIITTNGAESISFIETPTTFKIEDVNTLIEYFNPVTGLFDPTMSFVTFESGTSLLLKQAYTTTAAELIALN